MRHVLRHPFIKVVSCYLVLTTLVIGMTPRVFAGFAPSEVITLSPGHRVSDLQAIQKTLETKMISQRLTEFGLTPEEVRARVNQLNDNQIHQFAQQLDQVKVGGDGFGFLAGLLVVAILVVILVYLLGHRIIIT